MAALVGASNEFIRRMNKDVEARHKAGHDGSNQRSLAGLRRYLRHRLQHGTDSGGILHAVGRLHGLVVDGIGGVEQRRRRAERLREVADHVPCPSARPSSSWWRRRSCLHHHRRAQFEHARIAGAGRDQIEDRLRIEAGLHAEHHGFGGGDVVDRDQKVGDVFHLAAVAKRAEVVHLAREAGEQRLQPRIARASPLA